MPTNTAANIIADADCTQLLTNKRAPQHDRDFERPPVTKLFMLEGPGTWLIS